MNNEVILPYSSLIICSKEHTDMDATDIHGWKINPWRSVPRVRLASAQHSRRPYYPSSINSYKTSIHCFRPIKNPFHFCNHFISQHTY
ncbi:MAG TPA: hypothetical protein VEV83_01255 [Parafilimonas sp.]|nr:hypothetical protein [Parafilimonas sp.]